MSDDRRKAEAYLDSLGEDGIASEVVTRLKLVCADDVKPERVDWMWPSWLPYGKLVSFVGVPSVGKSTVSTDLIARATRGGAMPGESTRFAPKVVLIAGVEDGWADTIRPRLEAANADLEKVFFVQDVAGETLTIPRDVPTLEALAKEVGASWLHFDAIMGVMAEEVNTFKDSEVRRAMTPLKEMAERRRMIVSYTSHPRKAGGLAVHAGGGSGAFTAVARVLIFAGFDPSDATEDLNLRNRVLAVGKNNLAKIPASRSYKIVDGAVAGMAGMVGCIAWGNTSSVTADELAQPFEGLPRERREPTNKPRDAAEVFLEEILADGKRITPNQIKADALRRGLKWRTVERAAEEICVKERTGFQGGSVWCLAIHAKDDSFPPFPPTESHREGGGETGGDEDVDVAPFGLSEDEFDALLARSVAAPDDSVTPLGLEIVTDAEGNQCLTPEGIKRAKEQRAARRAAKNGNGASVGGSA